jgi:hypothetical protein
MAQNGVMLRKRIIPTMVAASSLLDDAGVAALFIVKPRTVRLWRETRGLPFIRITKKIIRYRREDVDAWAAGHRVALAA